MAFKRGLRRLHVSVLSVIIACMAVGGCEKTLVENPTPGSIYGKVISREKGVFVSVQQPEEVAHMITESDGYFAINGLQPGVYKLVFRTPSGREKFIEGINVRSNEAVNLYSVDMHDSLFVSGRSYPMGLDQISWLPSQAFLRLYYNDSLDLSSVASAVSVSPSIRFTLKSDDCYYCSSTIAVASLDTLTPGTTYTVTIDSTLRSVQGIRTGYVERVSFTTLSLQVIQYGIHTGEYYQAETDTMMDPGLMETILLHFNTAVNIDSLNKAVSISPFVRGVWYTSQEQFASDGRWYAYFPSEVAIAEPEQVFAITIDSSVGLCRGSSVKGNPVFHLVTRPAIVTSVSPSSGSSWYAGSPVMMYFNTRMDTASVREAFTCMNLNGSSVSGSMNWNDSCSYFAFRPHGGFTPGQYYRASLTTDARCSTGQSLKVPAFTVFRVS